MNFRATLWKNEKFTLTKIFFRQINSLVIYLVNALVSRNFCQKSVRVNFRNFYSVPSFNSFFFVKSIWRRVSLLWNLISLNFCDKITCRFAELFMNSFYWFLILLSEKPLNQATVSLYFDNWSPYHLDLIADEIRSGTFSTGLLPHDLTPYSRGLALRSVSSKETKKSSGLIAWTLLENKIQLGKWIDTFY